MQPWFTVYFFDIGHPCDDQLTPVKSRKASRKQTCMYTSFFNRERQYLQYDPFRAIEMINRRILAQQTSQIYMYTKFFKRERQYDPFRAKEIINRRILAQQTSQIYMYTSFFKRERQ